MSSLKTAITPDLIRNIAIIAHVDHGKTTLVDSLFVQSGIYRDHEQVAERAMDHHDLEKERGITILAKNTAIEWGGHKINILDTPGHADFSGEVERVLSMVDGALLVVDAVEGPMPQTRFVLRKALANGLKIMLVVNKIDRPAADPSRAIDKVVDLLIELGADESQLEFPVVYASGLSGIASLTADGPFDDMKPLFQAILDEIPCPKGEPAEPLQYQVATLDYNDYVGRILIGRIHQGTLNANEPVILVHESGKTTQHRISKLYSFEGLKRVETEQAIAGDIVAVAGIPEATVGDTLCNMGNAVPVKRIAVEEPTLQMTFSVNNSPFAGREGQFVTSRQIRDRLQREIKTNISLRVEDGDTTDAFLVSGRGELHLSVLIETMRREGYEFQVSKPEVLVKQVGDERHEPFEEAALDVPDDMAGSCIEQLCTRRGEMQGMSSANGRTLLSFLVPSRGLLGFRSVFVRLTKGQGIMSSAFKHYAAWAGDIGKIRNGVLIANDQGDSTAYAIKNLEDRGVFFIQPRVAVYKGMIVGENNRSEDIVVNICKAKQLTNFRSAGADVMDVLATPQEVSLEFGLDFIANDELMEVTPQSIRLRKLNLNVK